MKLGYNHRQPKSTAHLEAEGYAPILSSDCDSVADIDHGRTRKGLNKIQKVLGVSPPLLARLK